MPVDPYIVAWTDQFRSLMRDKVLSMIDGLAQTGWDNMSHTFADPYDDDMWRMFYENDEFHLFNLTEPHAGIVVINLERLGITR